LVDWTKPFVQFELRVAPRRQIRHGPEKNAAPHPTDGAVGQEHVLAPPCDPHLAPFAFLVKLSCLKSSTSHT
jgi:hypothetical protein